MSQNFEKIAREIVEVNNFGKIKKLEKINIGFNSVLYRLNNQLVIKICCKQEKEAGIKREISFYQENTADFHPKLIASDTGKQIIPYTYLVQEMIEGNNLIDVWGSMSVRQRDEVLNQLVYILKSLHKKKYETMEPVKKLMMNYDENLQKLIETQYLPIDQIIYLRELRNNLESYFADVSIGYTHGDIHFNNLIWSNDKLKLIDFENYELFPIDKDFDSLSRMVRLPESYKQSGNSGIIIPSDYDRILPFFKENYEEVFNEPNFDERILIYDCLNSLKWITLYPEYELYHEVLFEKSKRLVS